jgi:hypothetical protein
MGGCGFGHAGSNLIGVLMMIVVKLVMAAHEVSLEAVV